MPKKTDTKAFRLQKRLLVGLAEWLNTQELAGRDSRIRSRFVADLVEAVTMLEKERLLIVKKYAVLDENGNPLVQTGDNSEKSFVISPEKQSEFAQEISELYSEEYVMNLSPETEEKLLKIKDIVLNTDYLFGSSPTDSKETQIKRIKEAAEYNLWCEAFEALD